VNAVRAGLITASEAAKAGDIVVVTIPLKNYREVHHLQQPRGSKPPGLTFL